MLMEDMQGGFDILDKVKQTHDTFMDLSKNEELNLLLKWVHGKSWIFKCGVVEIDYELTDRPNRHWISYNLL